jgi:hypothetical protein
MVWAISAAVAAIGLILLAAAALRLFGRTRELDARLRRLKRRADQAAELQQRVNGTAVAAQRIAEGLPPR